MDIKLLGENDVEEGESAYMVYCDIYRNNELIDEGSALLGTPVILKDDDDFLEDKLFAIADYAFQKRLNRRIAEDMIADITGIGGFEKGGYVEIEFTEPTYGVRIQETYNNFEYEKVHDYLECRTIYNATLDFRTRDKGAVGFYERVDEDNSYIDNDNSRSID